jgi:hypothetical protein
MSRPRLPALMHIFGRRLDLAMVMRMARITDE